MLLNSILTVILGSALKLLGKFLVLRETTIQILLTQQQNVFRGSGKAGCFGNCRNSNDPRPGLFLVVPSVTITSLPGAPSYTVIVLFRYLRSLIHCSAVLFAFSRPPRRFM